MNECRQQRIQKTRRCQPDADRIYYQGSVKVLEDNGAAAPSDAPRDIGWMRQRLRRADAAQDGERAAPTVHLGQVQAQGNAGDRGHR